MPRPMKNVEPLNKWVHIRITESLMTKLADAAAASGLELYDVIRRRLSGVRVPNRDYIVLIRELRVMRQELVRQGGLIKHLYSERKFEPELTREAWNKQISVLEDITKLIIRMEAVGNDSEDGGKT